MRRTRIGTTSLSTTLRGACLAGGGPTLPRKAGGGTARPSRSRWRCRPARRPTTCSTLETKGPHKLTVHLSKAGKKLLAADHGRLSAKILLAEKTPGGTVLSTRTIKIVPAKPKDKKK